MGKDWVNIAIPAEVQEHARKSDEPYHRLIENGLRYEEMNDDEQQAIDLMREKLDEWERELRDE